MGYISLPLVLQHDYILKTIKNATDTNVVFFLLHSNVFPFVYVFTSFHKEQERFSKLELDCAHLLKHLVKMPNSSKYLVNLLSSLNSNQFHFE